MVWEDKIAEREADVEYTNTNDVPIYVQVMGYCVSTSSGKGSMSFFIDGVRHGRVGQSSLESLEGVYPLSSTLHIVPSGGKYKVEVEGDYILNEWKEARMPVAVGSGKPVVFRGHLNADQTGAPTTAWAKVNLNTIELIN